MRRVDLEHLLRAAAEISGDDELVVVGSQAVLGEFPDAPAEMRVSVEADIYPANLSERAELIDGTIGELSPFHQTFGYYAQGVGPETAVLPDGWRDRAVLVRNDNTRGVTGICVEIHDLVVGKCVAGRVKDWAFLEAAIAHDMVALATLRERISRLSRVDETRRQALTERIERLFADKGNVE